VASIDRPSPKVEFGNRHHFNPGKPMRKHTTPTAATAILLALLSCRLAAQTPAVTILPDHPVAGDSVTITYDASAPDALLKGSDSVSAHLYSVFEDPDDNFFFDLPMSGTGSRLTAGFRIKAAQVMFLVRFVSGALIDDNDGRPWNLLVSGAGNVPVRYAHFIRAQLYAYGGIPDFIYRKDSSRVGRELNEELRLHGDDPDVRMKCLVMMRETAASEAVEQYALMQVDSTFRKNRANRKLVESMLPFLDRCGMNAVADSIRSEWIRLDPQGLYAREARFPEIEVAENSDSALYALLCKYVADFPNPIAGGHDRRLRELYMDYHLVHLTDDNKADEAIRLFEALPEKIDEHLMNLINGLAWNGLEPERLMLWADTMLSRARDTVWANNTHYDSRRTMHSIKRSQEVQSLNCMGAALTKLGRHADALSVFREAYEKSDSSHIWLNRNLLRCHLANDHWNEALRFGVECIRNDAAGDSIPFILREEIRKRKGDDSQLDSLLAMAIEKAAAKAETDLAENRLNLPVKQATLAFPDGESFDLNNYLGEVIVLDFWATWCGPCRNAMPYFQKFYESVRNDPRIAVFSVNVWEHGSRKSRVQRVRNFIENGKYDFPVLLGDDCNKAFKLTSVPTTVIIDTKGLIQFVEVGSFLFSDAGRSELWKRIDMLLKEAR
jgi:thiol-disulfide isomerase/thioredoxin